MEKITDMKSPFTGGAVKEIYSIEQMTYKEEVFDVHVRYFVCVDTGEKFTNTEQDEEWFNELHTLYAQRHAKKDVI